MQPLTLQSLLSAEPISGELRERNAPIKLLYVPTRFSMPVCRLIGDSDPMGCGLDGHMIDLSLNHGTLRARSLLERMRRISETGKLEFVSSAKSLMGSDR